MLRASVPATCGCEFENWLFEYCSGSFEANPKDGVGILKINTFCNNDKVLQLLSIKYLFRGETPVSLEPQALQQVKKHMKWATNK